MTTSPELQLILAAQSARLPDELDKTGFTPMETDRCIAAMNKAGLWFGLRRVLEEEKAYRQIIPYVILRIGNQVVRYTRTSVGGEARLHGRSSVGLGGHVDMHDAVTNGEKFDLLGTIERACEREIEEELGDVVVKNRRWTGLLVDNDTEVGRVHIVLIAIWEIEALPDRKSEDAIGNVETVSLTKLEVEADMLEGWSSILLPLLGAELSCTLG